MALSEGSWLNHYEILGHIGTGGMGEVYRARDNKLQREVALKVLPKAFAQDPERVARFRREAQVLAQVNHPNIAGIHSVEESGGTHFLVMELAQGETLRDRIKRGPVPIEEALDIAKQIAAGLESAHEKPIVHRDLKPANVKVTPQGVAKILDFGLARAFAGDTGSSDPSDSPTLTGMTQPGTILGTAAYMSPEQARGKTVDKRADIWALGCVLYEMLAGKRVFEGEDVADIIGAVIHKEPDWAALPATTPPSARFLLRRCLEKDAKRRLSSAADLQIQMEESLSAPSTAVPSAAMEVPEPPIWQRAVPLHVAALVAIVTLLIGGLAVWNLRPTPAPQPVTRFSLTLPENQQFTSAGRHILAISPSGTHIVYVANSQIYLRAMDQLESTPIRGTEGGRSPFFSPDGQWVGFWATDRTLKKVSITGGAPVTLCEAENPFGVSWGPDDTIVFGQGPDSIWQVPASGGTKRQIVTLDTSKGESAHGPQILPGEKSVLFTLRTGAFSWDDAQIVVQDLQTGERRVLVKGGTDARYVPTGHLVYAQGGTLLALPLDPGSLEVTGGPVPIVEGVLQAPSAATGTGAAQFSFSSQGTLVFVPGRAGQTRTMAWVDRKGVESPLPAPPRDYDDPQLSPDGRQVAVQLTEGGGTTFGDIWIYDIQRATLTRLTFESAANSPDWTPDGKRIVFGSEKEGALGVYWKPADNSGAEERLAATQFLSNSLSVSSNGQTLAFSGGADLVGNVDIWVLSLQGDPRAEDRKPRPFLQTRFVEIGPTFSPDGRWLAYVSNESGRYEVYVQPFPGPGGKFQISTEGGVAPVWARNGRELFYLEGGKMMAVDITTQPTFTAGTPQMLFERLYFGSGRSADYDVSPDGQRFLMIRPGEQQSATQIHVVLNWFEELKQRVPTGN